MTTIRDIRRRLRSVENIRQITAAIEMIAFSRLNAEQGKALRQKPYTDKLGELLNIAAAASLEASSPFLEKRGYHKQLLVVVSSDKGHCGSYNVNIFHAMEAFLKEHGETQVELIVIGQKAAAYCRRRGLQVKKEILDWGGKITFPQIKAFAEELMQRFLEGDIGGISILYTHFRSIFNRTVACETYLPVTIPEEKKEGGLNYILEPHAEEIMKMILPRYCINKIQSMFNQAYASELAARILSMKAAVKNSEEMIESLTLLRNKIRQAGITKEMIEITSGGG